MSILSTIDIDNSQERRAEKNYWIYCTKTSPEEDVKVKWQMVPAFILRLSLISVWAGCIPSHSGDRQHTLPNCVGHRMWMSLSHIPFGIPIKMHYVLCKIYTSLLRFKYKCFSIPLSCHVQQNNKSWIMLQTIFNTSFVTGWTNNLIF